MYGVLTCCSAIAQKLMQETTQKLRHPNIIAYRIRIVSGKRTRAESAASLVHEILFMTAGSKGARKHGTIHDPVKSRASCIPYVHARVSGAPPGVFEPLYYYPVIYVVSWP